MKERSALHNLLIEACPEPKSIVNLAEHLDCSYQYVYRWIENNRVPPDFAKKASELGCVQLSEFYPYLFG